MSTCNRLEIYSLVKDPQLGIEGIKSFLLEFSGLDEEILFPHLFNFVQEKAILLTLCDYKYDKKEYIQQDEFYNL